MHILDLVMYFILLACINWLLPREFKEESGAGIGILIMLIYTFAYIILFWVGPFNMIDIFSDLESAVQTLQW